MHKLFVFKAGIPLKVPILRLIVHDWDKFLPSMWLPYARFFYHPDGSKKTERTEAEYKAFKKAFKSHLKRNDHHWNHPKWARKNTTPMSDSARREMLADWMGASRATTGKWEIHQWYVNNRDTMKLHPETTKWIEDMLFPVKDADGDVVVQDESGNWVKKKKPEVKPMTPEQWEALFWKHKAERGEYPKPPYDPNKKTITPEEVEALFKKNEAEMKRQRGG